MFRFKRAHVWNISNLRLQMSQGFISLMPDKYQIEMNRTNTKRKQFKTFPCTDNATLFLSNQHRLTTVDWNEFTSLMPSFIWNPTNRLLYTIPVHLFSLCSRPGSSISLSEIQSGDFYMTLSKSGYLLSL